MIDAVDCEAGDCEAGDCGVCPACARQHLARAADRLTDVYGFPVSLSVDAGRVIASPALPRMPPPTGPSPPEDERHGQAWAAFVAGDDIERQLELRRAREEARLRAFVLDIAERARGFGCRVAQGRHRLAIDLPSGRRLTVLGRRRAYAIDERRHAFTALRGLAAGVIGELVLDARFAPDRAWRFIDRLLAGERPTLDPNDAGLIDRLGLHEPDPPAAWLRAELQAVIEHGPGPGGLGSPTALVGVSNRSGRLLAIDGVPLRHVDAEAFTRWRLWAVRRAAERGRPLTWRPVTWGVAVSPGDGRAWGPPASASACFDRHRRIYSRSSEPGPGGRRRIDWGRREAVLPLDPPPRARVGELYEPIARRWLAGWSLNALAEGSGASRSAVDRLIRSTRARARQPNHAGPWLAIDFDRVVVTDRPEPGERR